MAVNKRQYSETIDHLLIKNFLTDNIPLENDVKKIDQEIKIGNRIADIFIELTNVKKIVIEIQHSRISKADLIQRTKEYNEQGLHVLWILDGTGPYDRKPQNEPLIGMQKNNCEGSTHPPQFRMLHKNSSTIENLQEFCMLEVFKATDARQRKLH